MVLTKVSSPVAKIDRDKSCCITLSPKKTKQGDDVPKGDTVDKTKEEGKTPERMPRVIGQ